MGAQYLAHALETNSRLKKLCLANNDIDDSGCQYLAPVLKRNRYLRVLRLHENKFTAVGAGYLFEAIQKNNTLRTLGCSSNEIGDAGFGPINQALLCNSTLANLDLYGCGFSAVSVEKLKFAVQSKHNIIDINLRGDDIGEDLLSSLMAECQRNRGYIATGLALLDRFLMEATRLPSDVRRLIVAYSCPIFNQQYASNLDDRLRLRSFLKYFFGLHQHINSISDVQEKRIAFYEFKIQLSGKLDLPAAWQQQFEDLEYSGYPDFYNQLREFFGYVPVERVSESSCTVM